MSKWVRQPNSRGFYGYGDADLDAAYAKMMQGMPPGIIVDGPPPGYDAFGNKLSTDFLDPNKYNLLDPNVVGTALPAGGMPAGLFNNSNGPAAPKKSNVMLYVGAGVAGLALLYFLKRR